MLRKIVKGFFCFILWDKLVFAWLRIFDLLPVTNAIPFILSLIFAIASCYGIIFILKWAWGYDG